MEPVPLAALVYFGSGIALFAAKVVMRAGVGGASLTRKDIPWLVGAIIAGGVIAPISQMVGLNNTSASTASLLLNFEGVATALLAVLIFKEAVGRQIWWAIGCITIAGIILTLDVKGGWGISLGALGIIAACVFWGLDNNLTRNISSKDPVLIAIIKGLVAGSFSMLIAKAIGSHLPDIKTALITMAFGSISYGLSVVFFILALRGLGAARTGAYFGSAPFVGALASIAIFRTAPDIRFLASLPFMVIGAILLLSEDHNHHHFHDPIEHDHSHTHSDDHHHHDHPGESITEPHSHPHKHKPIKHSHPHSPDDHHRHSH